VARWGIAARVIDDKTGPTPLGKAVGISGHSLDILEPSNVAERLLAAGLKIQHAYFHFESHELGVIDFSILPHRYNFLLSLPPNGGFRDPHGSSGNPSSTTQVCRRGSENVKFLIATHTIKAMHMIST
jgi:hypothetical protein